MTPQIKQRIEQIRRGEVPDGYKRTKVGIVPEEWKIKRLAQVLRKQTCKNTDNAIHNVLTNSATRGIVGQKDYFDKQIANSENTDNYYIVENGYFVYNPRISVSAHCGPFNKYYGCEKGIMSPLYTVYKYIDCSTDYTEYLSYFFSSANWHRYMNSIANYGARNDRMNVTSDTMSAMPLPYPPLFEQKKITEILQTQDKLIELQQKKIEELKKLKKAYLSKMFPKKGCNVPEIRFLGFTDPWEQRKLGELALFNPKDELPQTFEYVDLESVVGTEMLSHRTEAKSSAPSRAQRLAHTGDLFYQTVRPYQRNNYLFEKPDNNYVFSTGYAQMRPYVDGYFLLSLVQSDRFVKVVLDNCTGTSYPAINANDLAEIEVSAPLDENEAQKIGTIFRNIDHLITLHQRKLEEMKIYKKSLLQLLLTGIVRM